MSNKYYYEINFYGQGHEKDYTFYIGSSEKLSIKKIIYKLENEFIGIDGLEQHHIDNIVVFGEIDAEEYTNCCGLTA